MGSITLNKPSGGQLTLSPEDGATNETVTIPSVGVGKVLQEVSQSWSTSTSITSTSFVSTPYSLSVTPLSQNSKFIVSFTGGGMYTTTANAGYGTIYRDSTNLGSGVNGLERQKSSATYVITPHSMEIADAPNTFNSITYAVYGRSEDGTSVAFHNVGYGYVTLTVMEVAQ